MKIHRDVAQGTTAWLQLRAGIPTASAFDRIVTPGGKASSQAAAYMHTLLYERITGRPLDGFQSSWMARGSALESEAVDAYEFQHDVETEVIGFVTNDAGTVGCSPDRFIKGNSKRMLETKCPSPDTHIGYLLAGDGKGLSKEYHCQLQGELWVCEMDEVDILSYHPDLPNVEIRVTRDDTFIATLAAHVNAFALQLEEKAAKLAERGIVRQERQGEAAPFLTNEDVIWAAEYAQSFQ